VHAHTLRARRSSVGSGGGRCGGEGRAGDAPVGTDSVVLALGTFFDADAAGDLSARYELRLGESTFNVRIADRAIEVDRGAAEDPHVTIETDAATLSALIWDRRDLADALRAGDISIRGDRGAVPRFLELFRPPRRAAAA
jgi:alkyl sulfatase BDS1-like metallo-beta-lactamase superfamily hydrolase